MPRTFGTMARAPTPAPTMDTDGPTMVTSPPVALAAGPPETPHGAPRTTDKTRAQDGAVRPSRTRPSTPPATRTLQPQPPLTRAAIRRAARPWPKTRCPQGTQIRTTTTHAAPTPHRDGPASKARTGTPPQASPGPPPQ